MITTAVPRKVLRQPERMAALTAIATAKSKRKHVGIRPKKEREPEKKTAGILVPPERNPGAGLHEALRRAGAAWPEGNTWEVFGADDFEQFPNQSSCSDAFGDGCFDAPYVFGEFDTADEPSLLDVYSKGE